jgi:hypothetical protein
MIHCCNYSQSSLASFRYMPDLSRISWHLLNLRTSCFKHPSPKHKYLADSLALELKQKNSGNAINASSHETLRKLYKIATQYR